jgi:hypothetical protein
MNPFNLTIPLSTVAVLPPAPRGERRPLLTPLSAPGEFLLVLDNTALEKFTTCPTRAYNYLVLGREAHAKDASLVFGGAIHAGLEALEHGKPEADQTRAIIDYWTNNPAPMDEYRTLPNAIEVLKHYRVRASFPDYRWTGLSDDSGPLIERAFELPLGVIEVGGACIEMPWLSREVSSKLVGLCSNPPRPEVKRIHVAWSGRVDRVVNYASANRIVDHKTTKFADDRVVQAFVLSPQTRGYVWAAQQLWPELDITGCCINFIHLRPPAKGVGIADKGPRGGDPALNLFRSNFNYSALSRAEWHRNTMLKVSNFIQSLVHNEWEMRESYCFEKYGRCPYHDSCVQDDPQVRRNILMSDMYREVTWNPTADR